MTPMSFDRRTFLRHAACCATFWAAFSGVGRGAVADGPSVNPGSGMRVVPFDLHSVRLRPGVALEALQINRRSLMSLEPDRLLHMFRVTAGLPSSATPLGGWEAPNNELRGHFTGHFLSACWKEKGIRLVQETRFPHEESTRLTIHAADPIRMPIRIRVPYWSRGGRAWLNGRRLEGFAAPASYFVLDRTWRDGDRIEVQLPMRLHAAPMPDDSSLLAVMYGPLVLAGRLGTAGLNSRTLRAVPTPPRKVPEYAGEPVEAPSIAAASFDPASWLQRAASGLLEFETVGQARRLTLVPLNRILNERYAVYWKVSVA